MAIQLLTTDKSDDWLELHEVPGVDFNSSAFTILPESFQPSDLPEQCPSLVDAKFNLADENKRPATVALGFVSAEAKEKFYQEMARRIASDYSHASSAWRVPATLFLLSILILFPYFIGW